MDVVKALLVFFVLSGCAEVATELPLARGTAAAAAEKPTPHGDAARLGPPNPAGAGARHVDHAAVSGRVALN